MVIAGGQSLVPAMNFRLARPAHLLDLNGVLELDYLRAAGGELAIGALQRHAAFQRPVVPGPLGRLLADVQPHIAHYPIRERGTFCGSIAHADPAAEWCLVAVTLDARIVVRGVAGERLVRGDEFILGTFATALRTDEIISEVRLPLLDDSYRYGFEEFSLRAGDFALAMTLALVRMDGGLVREARIGVGGVADRPCRIRAAEDLLVGARPDASVIAEAARLAASALDPMEDQHADAAYRRDLAQAVTRRALTKALA